MERNKIARVLYIYSILASILEGLFLLVFMPQEIGMIAKNEEFALLKWPGIIGMYIIAIVCFYAVYRFLSVIKNIEHNNSFCHDNVEHMKVIGHCAFTVGILIILGDLFVFVLGLLHPGLLLFSLIIIFIAGAFCVVSYSLSSLIKQAVYIKEENDLTI